jgi:hypothetical protein
MTPDALFRVANTMILPAWLLLIALPRWRHTQRIAGWTWPVVLAVLYATIVLRPGVLAGADMGTLAGVMRLFENPLNTTAGWIHYLCFDLFTGAWEVRESQRLGISHVAVIPCLLLTLMLGPLGLLLFLLLRGIWKREWAL